MTNRSVAWRKFSNVMRLTIREMVLLFSPADAPANESLQRPISPKMPIGTVIAILLLKEVFNFLNKCTPNSQQVGMCLGRSADRGTNSTGGDLLPVLGSSCNICA